MIVPLIIWSDLTLIDSHAWTAATIMPLTTAAATEIRSTGVRPPIAVGSPLRCGASSTPTYQPTKAAVSIVPSMPMLTTPDRSHSTPHRAANAIGVADRMMLGANVWTTSSSHRASSKTMPTTGRSVRRLGSTRQGPPVATPPPPYERVIVVSPVGSALSSARTRRQRLNK